MMKVRTMKPAVRMLRGKVNQKEISRLRIDR
jgi:hypothetical protein